MRALRQVRHRTHRGRPLRRAALQGGTSCPTSALAKLAHSVIHGSFSKTVTPGMRLGFMITQDDELMQHLHHGQAVERPPHEHLLAVHDLRLPCARNEYQQHVDKITALYKEQSDTMLAAIKEYFPRQRQVHGARGRHVHLGHASRRNVRALSSSTRRWKRRSPSSPAIRSTSARATSNTFRLNYTNSTDEVIPRRNQAPRRSHQRSDGEPRALINGGNFRNSRPAPEARGFFVNRQKEENPCSGLKGGRVALTAHDGTWEAEAARTAELLRELLGAAAADIEHVGSTAVRGIEAKPIIDIAVAARSLEEIKSKAGAAWSERLHIQRCEDVPGTASFRNRGTRPAAS